MAIVTEGLADDRWQVSKIFLVLILIYKLFPLKCTPLFALNTDGKTVASNPDKGGPIKDIIGLI